MIVFEGPPLGYTVLWSVDVGAVVDPVASGFGARVINSVVVVDAIENCAGLNRER